MDKADTSIRFTLPNGTRWIAKADSPLNDMFSQVMRSTRDEVVVVREKHEKTASSTRDNS